MKGMLKAPFGLGDPVMARILVTDDAAFMRMMLKNPWPRRPRGGRRGRQRRRGRGAVRRLKPDV